MELTRRLLVTGLSAGILTLPRMRGIAAPGPVVLEAAAAKLRLEPAPAAEADSLAYNGVVPGPLIRVQLGDAVHVRLVNKLSEPTTLCWHGVRIANAMDGVAGLTQPAVKPNDSFDYHFKPPDAGLYWYHPQAMTQSAGQIRRGLYGVLLVEEAKPPPVDHDIVAVISDFAHDVDTRVEDRHARRDPVVLVNGRPAPLAASDLAPGARIRLRLLNACGSQIVRVTLAGMDASIVAIDGQPSELFPPAGGTIPIGPGARFELIGDLPAAPGTAVTIGLRAGQADLETPLMRFATKGVPIPKRPAVGRLTQNPLLPTRIPLERSAKRDLVIANATSSKGSAWTINGVRASDYAGRPLFQVKRGQAVTLAFINRSSDALQMHPHGHVFRVLHDLDDGWDPYWRDSILLAPGKTKHIAFIADNPGKWALESSILDQQIAGLAGWFEVT